MHELAKSQRADAPRALEQRAATRREGRRGFTLIEVLVGLVVLLVGVMSFSGALVSSIRATKRTDEINRATKAAHAILERIEAEAFADAFRRFNGNTGDDPGGAGTAPGAGFAVAGLDAQPGDADGLPGEVEFPIQPGDPSQLREDATNPDLGMPRDLNGDGVVDSLNHATDYRLLPLVVRVRWRSSAGSAQVEFKTMIANY